LYLKLEYLYLYLKSKYLYLYSYLRVLVLVTSLEQKKTEQNLIYAAVNLKRTYG